VPLKEGKSFFIAMELNSYFPPRLRRDSLGWPLQVSIGILEIIEAFHETGVLPIYFRIY
jgi:hypothetical protein